MPLLNPRKWFSRAQNKPIGTKQAEKRHECVFLSGLTLAANSYRITYLSTQTGHNTMQVITFTEMRKHLRNIMDTSADRHESIIVTRPNGAHMIMMSLEDFEGIRETNYLLENEANIEHLRHSISSYNSGTLIKKDLIE